MIGIQKSRSNIAAFRETDDPDAKYHEKIQHDQFVITSLTDEVDFTNECVKDLDTYIKEVMDTIGPMTPINRSRWVRSVMMYTHLRFQAALRKAKKARIDRASSSAIGGNFF
ncbi:hypothetical protein RND71_021922 [Anisodus tanguticus]|uniref:Uncharacterized protein n=1 Tax=Anisodus tanguticus TaxID=243964 RepID=A0AAE1V7R0_9SOLA|nr:hypothetical protein RND71_021922 [Anisodus tanguticus]